jgi:hypothetical protein
MTMDSIKFVVQFACDFTSTLPLSARGAFAAEAQKHINALEAIVRERDKLVRDIADKSQEGQRVKP